MALFDEHYVGYDSWYLTPMGVYVDKSECRQLFDRLKPGPGMEILDVGCGTGHFALKIASEGADVVGIDISNEMLGVARKKAKAAGLHVPFILEDILHTSFEDERFDAAFTNTAFEFIEDKRAAYTEVMRILKPGGVFVIGAINGDGPWRYENESKGVLRGCTFFDENSIQELSPSEFVGVESALFVPPGLADSEYTMKSDAEYRDRGAAPGYLCAEYVKAGR
jgi:ubiquinone/menaquinone biosynthesis C-methylase UbiE